MRSVNRKVLTEFCKTRNRQAEAENPEDGSEPMIDDSEEEKEGWADEILDEELKIIFGTYENGRGIPIDIICHLEYFYNTLECSFTTKNPFDAPQNHPALLFRVPISNSNDSESFSPCNNSLKNTWTMFEKHRMLIFPNSIANKSFSKASSSPDVSPVHSTMLAINGQFSQNTA